MKTLHYILFLLFVSCALARSGISTSVTAPVSDDVLLSAIATVETGNNPSRLGHYGERTQLQILPATWREFSRLPHAKAAANRAETLRVARAYLSVIRHRLHERGLPETPFYIAACWNAGPSWKHLSSGTISYATCVANVVAEEQAKFADMDVVATEAPVVAPTIAATPKGPTGPIPVISLTEPVSTSPINLMTATIADPGPHLYLLATN